MLLVPELGTYVDFNNTYTTKTSCILIKFGHDLTLD